MCNPKIEIRAKDAERGNSKPVAFVEIHFVLNIEPLSSRVHFPVKQRESTEYRGKTHWKEVVGSFTQLPPELFEYSSTVDTGEVKIWLTGSPALDTMATNHCRGLPDGMNSWKVG